MNAACLECGAENYQGLGICEHCGGVAIRPLRAEGAIRPWDGITPVIQSRIPELAGTWLKLESASETGSFKDRIMRVLVKEASEAGHRLAVVASSGNAAISASFFCARLGLKLVVVVPTTLSPASLGLLSRFPLFIIQFGQGPAASHAFARQLAQELGVPNLSSTFSSSGAEYGCRVIGHEIHYQLKESDVEVVAASISVGPVLLGTRNGLIETGRKGPTMVAGQASGCSPIARAFESGAEQVEPWSEPVTTAAASIADTLAPYPDEATFFLGQLRESGGFIAAGDDDVLEKIRRRLRELDGVDVELACCAAIYALVESGRVGPNSVVVLTGSGQRETLRDQEALHANRHEDVRVVSAESENAEAVWREVLSWSQKLL